MLKRRETKASGALLVKPEPTKEQIEAFASAADGGIVQKNYEPSNKKDFKSIRVSFSEAEYNQLHEAAKIDGRSKLSFIRKAILEMAESLREKTGKRP